MGFELVGVRKSFARPGRGPLEVLNLARLAASDGEHVCLVGGSGTGKTTLLNVLAGITLPDSGSVVVKGTDITTLSEGARDRFRARNVGYMFQVFNLLQAYSAIENVLLPLRFAGIGGRAATDRAQSLLDRVGLSAKRLDKPAALSVGEQQRVALARAVACRPALVLADEPTANLDPANAANALALLKEVASESGAGLVVVTHDDRVKAQFSRVETLGGAS
jgi:putative ABC transport system ATP-binding protein